MDFAHLGFDNFNLENVAEINKQKCHERAAINEDELRDFKTAKTTSSCNEAMLRFPIHRSEGHQQMLSFSQPVNLPYYPHAFGRNSGGINGGNMQQGLRSLFTASQWMELEHQALIYKYITANVPIPCYLLNPIRKAFQSAGFPALRSNSLGWGGFQLGFSNSDPEPGRCRRTDGKKWRCSRDAVADQKYCERHMNRGRHRSRKPVEPTTAAATSATVTPSDALSRRLPDLRPAPTNNRSLLNKEDTNGEYQHTTLLSITSPKVGPKDTNFFPHKHQTTPQESSFGLVCSDSLLNPLLNPNDHTNKSQHPLRQFMDDWPKTHLSISIPTATSDFMSATSSPRELEMGLGVGPTPIERNPRQANWVPISWEPSMGGPLGEVLHSSTGECMNASTSPTGVLQRGPFVSLSNSSTASSPRAETGGSANAGLMNPSVPAL